MKKHILGVFAIVVFILVIGCGTASAFFGNSESMQSVVINMMAHRMASTDKETVG